MVERSLLAALTLVGSVWAVRVHHVLPWAIFNEQYLGLFLALGLAPVFLAVRASPHAPRDRVPWYDWLLSAGGLAVGGYVMLRYPTIAYTLGVLSARRGRRILFVLSLHRRHSPRRPRIQKV